MTRKATPTKAQLAAKHHDRGTRRLIMAGSVAMIALFVGCGGWAATTSIRSAVIATGNVVVETSSKRVQHAEGGIVGQLLVHGGDYVQSGQVLVRLDATITRAELAIVRQRMFDLQLRQARLLAQRNNDKEIAFPAGVLQLIKNQPSLQSQLKDQRRILHANRTQIASQLAQLQARIGQLQAQITGMKDQVEAKDDEIKFINNDLKRYGKLNQRRLISVTKLNDKKRMGARARGERGQILASMARAKGQIFEMQIRAQELRNSVVGDVLKELNEVDATIAELAQRQIKAVDLLSRIDIRAPIAGRVHELAVHTVGGVIARGETLMLIVPQSDKLIVEARISTADIDQVRIGMDASIRFTAFSQRTTPELSGEILTLSPDRSVDPQTGQAYFMARVKLQDDQLAKLGGKVLKPGMPADVMMTAESRTVLSYLVKPLTDQFERALREL